MFEKTFHYTQEGWDRFTFSFAWFFMFTAVLNEVVRQVFDAETMYPVPLLGEMNGVEHLDPVQDRFHHAGQRHLCLVPDAC